MRKNLQLLKKEKIIAIVRDIKYESFPETAQALFDGGVKLLEITLNTEGALKMISNSREKYDNDVCIGAGTVLNLNMARDAVNAGAEYLISPNLDEKVIEYAISKGIDVWPGVMTPTEIVRAQQLGVSTVKVFPAGILGESYLRDIRGPLNHINLIATGGVHLNNINEFLSAGAIAVGLGGSLVNKRLVNEKRFEEITELTRKFINKSKGG